MSKSCSLYKRILIAVLFFNLCLFTQTKGQTLLINEFMASNDLTIADEAGEFEDWLEIYNYGTNSIDVGGMYLSDGDLTVGEFWQIPTTDPAATTIPAGGYLLFWCDKDDAQGILHADFKLSAAGESIGLFDSNENLIDAYTFGTQQTDISFGRQPNGGTAWATYATSTPGASNDGGVIGLIEKPTASHPSGHYDTQISVALTSNLASADIHYSLDGSRPDATYPIYTTPFSLDTTTTLRAIAVSNGSESRIMTHTYLYGLNHEFAVVCISTEDEHFWDPNIGLYENPGAGLEHPAHIEMFEPNGDQGFAVDAGIRLQGAVTIFWPRKTIGVIMRDDYGDSKINYQIFPNREDDEYDAFILRSSGQDFNSTMFRDAMASSLVRDIEDVDGLIEEPNLDLQEYRPSVVYLNGTYFGVHNMREKMDHRYIERRKDIDDDEVDIMFKNDDLIRGTDTTWLDFREFYEDHSFETEVMMDSLKTKMDIDHYIDYILFGLFIDNTDWPGNNNRRYREQAADAKWRWLTYDLDFGFGLRPINEIWESGDPNSNSVAMVMDPMGTEYYNVPWATLLLRRILENDQARTDYLNRAADQLNVLYNTERLLTRLDEFETAYTDEIAFYNANFNNIIWDYPNKMSIIRYFAENRTPVVWDDFEQEFSDVTGQAEISITSSPIEGGKVEWSTLSVDENYAPFAGKHFQGISVPVSAVAAPGYVFSHWTGLPLTESSGEVVLTGNTDIVAHFVLGSTQIADVVINEINYESNDNFDAGDWIELYNNSGTTVDLSAWYFEDESDEYFSIPTNTMLAPGAYLVLVEDSTLFTSMFPNVTNFIGNFGNSINGDFKLSNGGELITIRNANNSFSDAVEYDNNAPWPTNAAGTGATLQLINPSLDNALAESWLPVAPTPGAQNDAQISQSIDFTAISDKETNDLPFDVFATASSGLAITYSIVSGPATISGNTITLGGTVGTVTVEANQPGDINYSPAPPVTQTFQVTEAVLLNQSIDFTAIPDKETTATPFDVFAVASSGLAVEYTILSGPATISGNTIMLDGVVGTVTVEASQPGNINYNPAAPVTNTFEVTEAVLLSQNIDFLSIPNKFVNDIPFDISAAASSALAVSFSIVSGPATIAGNTITLTGLPGTVIVQADQSGNADYYPAPAVQQSFDVSLVAQTITFEPISDKLTTDPSFEVLATASSGLPVDFTVTGPATIDGSSITLNGVVGFVQVTASQVGDAVYAAAQEVVEEFEVLMFISNNEIESASPLILVYPNPVHDKLQVEINSELKGNYNLYIHDALGRLVYSLSENQNESHTIDVSNIADGIYTLTLTENGRVHVARFVKAE